MQDTAVTQEARVASSDSLFQPRTLLTVRQFADKHPAFSQGSLRNLIFLAEKRKTSMGVVNGNGLDVALVRIGRKLLIDESNFFKWIDAQQVAK